jgi:hypothetical protein
LSCHEGLSSARSLPFARKAVLGSGLAGLVITSGAAAALVALR